VELPDTTLGRIMREWLTVIESGKEEEIRSFVEGNFSSNAFRRQQSAAEYVALFRKLHEQSGGLDVVRVLPGGNDQPLSIIVKSRRGERYAIVRAGLDSTERKLAGLGIDKAAAPDEPKLSDISRSFSEKEMIAAIQKDLDKRATAGDFSGVVLIARGDKILLRRAYGYADREAKTPNSVETKFHLASVGKMFTAVAIAQLVKAGKLSFTDTIAKVLPDYPNKEVAEKVTIHQLLTHSAGFGTFFESPGFVRGKTYRNSTEEIAVYQDEKLFSTPGTRWRYSNAGYSLLGAIVERLSGKPYVEYVWENIFKPLGMRDTYTNANGKAATKTSVFYTQSPLDPLGLDPYVADRALAGGRPTGFGGGFSTASDMLKFLRALRSGKLLGDEMTRHIAEGKFTLDDKGARRWAYGMSDFVVNGEHVRGHQGGSRVDVQVLWESGYTVIVLQNAIPPPVNAVSNDIAAFITSQIAMRGKANDPRHTKRSL
jgi:CubicO group peptidase (beta-lactamase class C family)